MYPAPRTKPQVGHASFSSGAPALYCSTPFCFCDVAMKAGLGKGTALIPSLAHSFHLEFDPLCAVPGETGQSGKAKGTTDRVPRPSDKTRLATSMYISLWPCE
jgi:hypothetical protein